MIEKKVFEATNWIKEYSLFFNPLTKTGKDRLFVNKMFAELQLTLMIAYRNRDILPKSINKIFEELLLFSGNIITSPCYYESIQYKPNDFRAIGGSIIFFLESTGEPKLETLINQTYNTALNITPEVIPYRKMDLEYCLFLASRYIDRSKCGIERLQKLAESSILSSNFDLVNFTVYEEYALTHALFYLSDLGNLPISKRNIESITSALLTLTCKNILKNDMDLLGEYLINLSNLKIDHSIRNLGYKILLENQQKDGCFLAPIRKEVKTAYKPIDKDLDSKGYVRLNYHTTLVAIMALIYEIKNQHADKRYS